MIQRIIAVGSSIAHLDNPIIAGYKNDPQVAWVGIDRGARELLRAGLPLNLAVGDFDSVTAEERQAIQEAAQKSIVLPSEKNDTDTEAALTEMIKNWPQAEHIIFYGMLGGRLDHTLNNLWMAYQDRFQPVISRLEFVSDTNTVRFLEPGDHTIYPYEGMTYLSLISMGPVSELTLKDVKYRLEDFASDNPRSFISNEFLPDGRPMSLSFTSGLLMVLQTRDAH